MALIRFFIDSDPKMVREIQVPAGTSLVSAANNAGWTLRSDCGGHGICGKCHVRVNGKEQLACQIAVYEDLIVAIPLSSLKIAPTDIVIQKTDFLSQTAQTRNFSQNMAGQSCFGIALDIGTTTVVAELLEKNGTGNIISHGAAARANPQREFGDDIISRIQKIAEEPIVLSTMQSQTVSIVAEMIAELCTSAGTQTASIAQISVAGNSVMSSIFHGIDPSPLGQVPFEPSIRDFPDCTAAELGFFCLEKTAVTTLPILGGFVGGDITAGILATRLHEMEGPALLLDLGTNGELALQHEGKIDTAATAAGPALEGGRIEFGCQAVSGAIDHVELYPNGGMEISTINNLPARGLCGSGLIDTISELRRHGLIDPTGRFVVQPNSPWQFRWKNIDGKANFVLAEANESSLGTAIWLPQRDVRQFQLAVGAIRAGIQILLQKLLLTAKQIKHVDIAGGFGSFIRPEAAQQVGLIPWEIPLERVRFCGNTSLAGARLALFNAETRTEAQNLARQVRHHDLSTEPGFAAVFAASMRFSD